MAKNKNLLSGDDLLSEFRKAVKTANRRMDRLEQAGMTGASAYRMARYMIGDNGTRFSAKISGGKFDSSDMQQVIEIRNRMNDVQAFLDSETSTVKGNRESVEKASATLEERYGLVIAPEQMSELFDGALWAKLNAKLQDSKTVAKLIGELQESDGNIRQAFDEFSRKHKYLDPNERMSIGATIGNYMRKNKLDYLFEE